MSSATQNAEDSPRQPTGLRDAFSWPHVACTRKSWVNTRSGELPSSDPLWQSFCNPGQRHPEADSWFELGRCQDPEAGRWTVPATVLPVPCSSGRPSSPLWSLARSLSAHFTHLNQICGSLKDKCHQDKRPHALLFGAFPLANGGYL